MVRPHLHPACSRKHTPRKVLVFPKLLDVLPEQALDLFGRGRGRDNLRGREARKEPVDQRPTPEGLAYPMAALDPKEDRRGVVACELALDALRDVLKELALAWLAVSTRPGREPQLALAEGNGIGLVEVEALVGNACLQEI